MAIPAIIGLIGSVLGSRGKDNPNAYAMGSNFGTIGDSTGQQSRVLPGTWEGENEDEEMVWDEKQKKYVKIGPSTRIQPMQSGGGGMSIGEAVGTAQGIGSMVNSMRGK